MPTDLLVSLGLPLAAVVISILVAQPQLRHSMESRIDGLREQVRRCEAQHADKDRRLADGEAKQALAAIEMERQRVIIERLASAVVRLGGDLGDYQVH